MFRPLCVQTSSLRSKSMFDWVNLKVKTAQFDLVSAVEFYCSVIYVR